MRFRDFDGEIPKLKPQALSAKHAQYAENVDLYGGLLRPHRAPQFQQYVVDEHGRPIAESDKAAMFAMVGSHAVGFPTDTHWVRDPRESAGAGTILFVRDGKLWRLSPRMVDAGTGATMVGIYPPKEAPTVAIAKGRGCLSQWDERCQDPEDCSPCADAPELRGYRITYVNECGEESAPSPVSNLIDIRNGDGAIVVDTNTPPANAIKRRYYRSATTSNGETVWLYVDEDVIQDTTFVDSVCPNALGEVLPTENHEPPSECLDGVALGRNMQTVVWSENQFWVSEPRLPHAYKPETRVTLQYPIQFIAGHTTLVEGTTHFDIAIATKGYPYMGQIRDDGQTTIRELEYWYPAVSPFAWGVQNGVVYYAAEAGLIGIVGAKVEVATDDYMTEREWAKFMPATMRITGYDQRLFLWYTKRDGTRAGLLLVAPTTDKRRPPSLSRLTLTVKSAYASPDMDMFMLIGTEVYKWGAGAGYMKYTWWSGVEVNSANWFPTVFKIVGDDVPTYSRGAQRALTEYELWRKTHCDLSDSVFFDEHPALRPYMQQILGDGADVMFTLYCDGREIYSRRVRHAAPIMIKRVRRGIEWSVKVSGTTELRELHLQKSLNDLQNDGGHA